MIGSAAIIKRNAYRVDDEAHRTILPRCPARRFIAGSSDRFEPICNVDYGSRKQANSTEKIADIFVDILRR
jgi:hypothetical protein